MFPSSDKTKQNQQSFDVLTLWLNFKSGSILQVKRCHCKKPGEKMPEILYIIRTADQKISLV